MPPEDNGPDLHDAVEAAFDAATKTETKTETTPPAMETPPVSKTPESVPADEGKPNEAASTSITAKTTETPDTTATQTSAPAEQTPTPGDEPPKAWRSGIRDKHWAGLPPEVKQEVTRREKEVAKVFGETAQVRQFASQFLETVRPYEARIRTQGLPPLGAIENLLKADHYLSSAPTVQRAQFMAKMIKEYGVDIKALDDALSGEAAPDPVQSKVDQLLQQRLAPLNQFLAQQQRQAQEAERFRAEQATTEIEQMEADPVKFPHFDAVRDQMADLVDFYASKGQYVPLDQVYQRAVRLDPTLGPQAVADVTKTAQQQAAAAQTAAAQRAQAASLSVSGSRSAIPASPNASESLRDSIEAAWSAHSGGR